MNMDSEEQHELLLGLIDLMTFVVEMYATNMSGIAETLIAAREQMNDEDRVRTDTYKDMYMYLGLLDSVLVDMARDMNTLTEEMGIE